MLLYNAFGSQTRADEIVRNRYRYNGEQYDGVTEQYYLRARFYNPAVARFTQEDVYRGDGVNLYAYCGNNAVGYEDPSGYSKCSTKSKKPGGYEVNDIDAYKRTKKQDNRAKGNENISDDGFVQAHHPIQNEWAEKNVPNYRKDAAPAILLKSASGEAHAKLSAMQRARRKIDGYNTDIYYEFNESYREMIKAGVNRKTAQKALAKAYVY